MAPIREVTATRRPTPALLMCRSALRLVADAPTVAVSALAMASTEASITTTLVRSGPPRRTVRRRFPNEAARRAAWYTGRAGPDRPGPGEGAVATGLSLGSGVLTIGANHPAPTEEGASVK